MAERVGLQHSGLLGSLCFVSLGRMRAGRRFPIRIFLTTKVTKNTKIGWDRSGPQPAGRRHVRFKVFARRRCKTITAQGTALGKKVCGKEA